VPAIKNKFPFFPELRVPCAIVISDFINRRGLTMLSGLKASCLAAAAVLVLSGSVVSATVAAPAQGNIQLAQNDQRDNNRGNETRRSSNREVKANRSSRNEVRSNRSSNREIRSSNRDRVSASSNRSRSNISSRTVVRHDTNRNRSRVVVRDRDRDHRWSWRHHGGSRSYSATTTFVVLGPRVHYAAYGAGWCRGLHRGRHWDRVHGWHSGRHYGPFRC
jgi:hypothetical protein